MRFENAETRRAAAKMGEALNVMESVRSIVFKESENLEGSATKIEGYDFNKGVNYAELFKSMASTGFQAANLGDAIQIVNQMVSFHFFLQLSLESFIALCKIIIFQYLRFNIFFPVNLDLLLLALFTE